MRKRYGPNPDFVPKKVVADDGFKGKPYQKLLQRLLAKQDRKFKWLPCRSRRCGRKFLLLGQRSRHYQRSHAPQEYLPPGTEDAYMEKLAKEAEEEAKRGLYLKPRRRAPCGVLFKWKRPFRRHLRECCGEECDEEEDEEVIEEEDEEPEPVSEDESEEEDDPKPLFEAIEEAEEDVPEAKVSPFIKAAMDYEDTIRLEWTERPRARRVKVVRVKRPHKCIKPWCSRRYELPNQLAYHLLFDHAKYHTDDEDESD